MAKLDPDAVAKWTLPLWVRLVRWGATALLTLVSADQLAIVGLTTEEVLGASTVIGGLLAWLGSMILDKIVNKKNSD